MKLKEVKFGELPIGTLYWYEHATWIKVGDRRAVPLRESKSFAPEATVEVSTKVEQ